MWSSPEGDDMVEPDADIVREGLAGRLVDPARARDRVGEPPVLEKRRVAVLDAHLADHEGAECGVPGPNTSPSPHLGKRCRQRHLRNARDLDIADLGHRHLLREKAPPAPPPTSAVIRARMSSQASRKASASASGPSVRSVS